MSNTKFNPSIYIEEKYFKNSVDSISDLTPEQRKQYIPISQISANWPKTRYITIQAFNDLLSCMFKHMNGTTNNKFQGKFRNVDNLVYLDYDYDIPNSEQNRNEKLNEINTSLSKYTHNVILSLKDKVLLTYSFKRLTYEHGGVHTFIFYDPDKTNREEFVNTLTHLISSNQKINDVIKNYELYENNKLIENPGQLIDTNTLKPQHTTVLPFAQKKPTPTPTYTLQEIYMSNTTEFARIDQNVQNLKTSNSPNQNYQLVNNEFYDLLQIKRIGFKELRKHLIKYINTSQNPSLYLNSDIILFLFDFCYGLSKMTNQHNNKKLNNIFEEFKHGGKYGIRKFRVRIYSIFIINVFLKHQRIDDYFINPASGRHILYLITSPMYISEGTKTDTNDLYSQNGEIIQYIFENSLKYMLDVTTTEHFRAWADIIINRINKIHKDDDPGEIRQMKRDYELIIKRIAYQTRKWFYYVKKYILENISSEIEHNTPLQIKCLNKMLISCLSWIYDYKNGVQNIIMKLVLQYMKDYIVIKDNEKIYIYNIQQTQKLESYPTNQFLYDTNGSLLYQWINEFYSKHLEIFTEEREKDASDGGLLAMIGNLERFNLPSDKISSKGFFQYFVKTDSQNVVITKIKKEFNTLTNKNLTEIDPTNDKYFAVRNGILEYFINDEGKYDIRLLENNKDIMINQYSLMKFNKEHFENFRSGKFTETDIKLIETLKKIYPIKQEFDFIMKYFSSTICPLIKKDRILFVYGTGSDGKSTMDKIQDTILGSTTEMKCEENGKQITLINPGGYAATFSTTTLTGEKQRGGHDESGTINMMNKTFAVGPELDGSEIKVKNLKEITSGMKMEARKIYSQSQSFVVNCLIVIETNVKPQFDIIDDAVKRRVVIYDHKAKFTTAANNSNYSLMEFKFEANEGQIRELNYKVEYWESLLCMYLTYALDLLNNECKGLLLSNIPLPVRVEQFTEGMLKSNNGIAGWLINNLQVNLDSFENLKTIHDKIVSANAKACREKQTPILKKYKNANAEEEDIYSKIFATYSGLIYRIVKPKIDISGATFTELYDNNIVSKFSLNNLYEHTENIDSSKIYETLILRDHSIVEYDEDI